MEVRAYGKKDVKHDAQISINAIAFIATQLSSSMLAHKWIHLTVRLARIGYASNVELLASVSPDILRLEYDADA
jgi:hypothetical protein